MSRYEINSAHIVIQKTNKTTQRTQMLSLVSHHRSINDDLGCVLGRFEGTVYFGCATVSLKPLPYLGKKRL